VVEGVGGAVGVAEAAVQGEGVLVVVDVAQAVQGGRLTGEVVLALVQSEGGLAVGAGGVVVA
jgi:hypothetical protein